MKVTLEKHGGFAAMRRAPTVVDSAALAADQKAELERLVADVRTESPATGAANEQMRDAMSYKISIEDQGGTMTYRQRDLEVSDAFGRLMRWIEERSGARPG